MKNIFKENIDKYGIINLIILVSIPIILVLILYGNSNNTTTKDESYSNEDSISYSNNSTKQNTTTKKYKYYNENPNLPKFDSVITEAELDNFESNLYKYVVGKDKDTATDYFVKYILAIKKEGFEYEESKLGGQQVFYIYDSNSVEIAKCFIGYENSNYIFVIGLY